jgi:hypothetical protein
MGHEPIDGPGIFWVWLPLDDKEPHADWRTWYRIVQQDHHVVIAEIRILPWPSTEQEERWITETLKDPDLNKRVLVDDNGNVTGPALRKPEIPDGGLPARALRGLRTTEALERVSRILRHGVRLPGFSPEALDEARWRIRSDRLLAEISTAYVEVLDSGAPIRELTRRLADQGVHYAEATIRDLVNEARNRELLTRPPKGRAGGQLTEKAKQLLS